MNKLINKILFEKTDNTLIQLFRYTFVGGTAFLVDFGLLTLLKEIFGFHYLLATTIGFLAGLVVNYVISIYWVFTESRYKNKKIEFLMFTLVGIVGLILTNIFMWLFVDRFDIHYQLSKIITTVIVYLWNFFGRKYGIFNKA